MIHVLFHKGIELGVVANNNHPDRRHVLLILSLPLEETLDGGPWSLAVRVKTAVSGATPVLPLEVHRLPHRPLALFAALRPRLGVDLGDGADDLVMYFPMEFHILILLVSWNLLDDLHLKLLHDVLLEVLFDVRVFQLRGLVKDVAGKLFVDVPNVVTPQVLEVLLEFFGQLAVIFEQVYDE